MRRRPGSRRILATVLFTDIVGSTELAARLEDRRWRRLLAQHHSLVRRELKRFGGREVDTAGDGFFAVFDQPAQAVRCAAAISNAVRSLGIDVRAGLHMGECELMGRKVGGIAVHIGARILGQAGPGEVLVSSTVKDLIAGSSLSFQDRGTHDLKGVPGEWRLFALEQEALPPPMEAVVEEAPSEEEGRPRRRRIVAVATGATLIAAAVTAFLLSRGGESFPTGPDSVARIDPGTNQIVGGVRVGAGPAAITVGRGAIWVANFDDKTLSRIDPSSGTEVARPGGVGIPVGIAEGEGRVWIVDGFADTLSILDPQTNQVVKVVRDAGGTAIAVGFGSVWVTDSTNDAVIRIDPSTIESDRIPLPAGSSPAGIAAGAGGVWVANSLGESVTRIDPTTQEVSVARIALCCQPSAIAVGGGAVWVTSSGADSVSKIDPPANSAVLSRAVGDAPAGIAAGPGGIWVANSQDGSVWRLDASTGEVLARIDVGGSPRGIVILGDGSIWVTVGRTS
jgi:YVTN family beta-propeller protein